MLILTITSTIIVTPGGYNTNNRIGSDRSAIHPVSITRFPLIIFSLRIFSPGAGLLRNPFVHR